MLFGNQPTDLTPRLALACGENTSTEVLEQLAQDENAEVRQAIAINPSTPDNSP
jgi:hypothetical protein